MRVLQRTAVIFNVLVSAHFEKLPFFMAVDLILIVKSNIIIIMMKVDKKIISFYLEFSKTRKIDEF